MKATGFALLPLHSGHAPGWLIRRMKQLADAMCLIMVREYGTSYLLNRLSDPVWFQSFGCVLGFDWHSSGVTTVVTGVLKDILRMERHGVAIAGGKGRASRRAPIEIECIGDAMGLGVDEIRKLTYSSRMCAKADTVALQDGYQLYHHSFVISEQGEWATVQQGLDAVSRTARRYHWHSGRANHFVEAPGREIMTDISREVVLDTTAAKARDARGVCVDLVRSNPNNLISSIQRLSSPYVAMDSWTEPAGAFLGSVEGFSMPSRLNWKLFKQLYDWQPTSYEDLVAFPGVGPSTIRSLALVAQLVHGTSLSWKDPVKYSFAFGGKDGVPFPVRRRIMDEATASLRSILEATEIAADQKKAAFRRLARVMPSP